MSADDRPGADLKAALRRRGSFGQTLRAVAWSFFGVRKSSDYEKDVNQINPLHVVIAGLLSVAVLIGVLLVLVRWAVGGGAG